MPTKDDQYIPTISEFNLFQDQVLKSKLNEIEKEMKKILGCNVWLLQKAKKNYYVLVIKLMEYAKFYFLIPLVNHVKLFMQHYALILNKIKTGLQVLI